MKPFFSIIVPCCDVEPYLRECLDSVVKQPFKDWECLLGVEESKDNTEEIAREYEAKDSRFKVFTGPRTGSCSASRNTGIDMAMGEYIIFLDGDDSIVEGSLQRLHDKISSSPGADLYPCAIQVNNGITGEIEELRDNYAPEASAEMTGPEATLIAERRKTNPCPMLQLTIFRRQFLKDNDLKCIVGLRRQDSEFSPRALYLAKRVIPLHEPFYIYRIRPNAVGSSATGYGYFHKDWAIILHSLLAFHAKVSRESCFDSRISECWARHWLPYIFYFWFSPLNVRNIPRARRVETLNIIFSKGSDNFDILVKALPRTGRVACSWVRLFTLHPTMRGVVELLFRAYFLLATARQNNARSK